VATYYGGHLSTYRYLAGRSYVEVIRSLARTAARHGILFTLANHRLTLGSNPGGKKSGLWYNDDVPLKEVKRAWSILAEALCAEWGVVGVDVQNEPFLATWGAALLHLPDMITYLPSSSCIAIAS